MAVKYIFVVDQATGYEVDRIEYDDSSVSPAVEDVMAALGMSQDDAIALVKQHNAGAELTSEENARALAAQIAAKTVPDRDADTYGPNADATLVVQDDNPTLAVHTSLVKIPDNTPPTDPSTDAPATPPAATS